MSRIVGVEEATNCNIYQTFHSQGSETQAELKREADLKREAEREAELKRELIRRLYKLEYNTQKDLVQERAEGTCEWFTSHESLRAWQETDGPAFLWVLGDPGCGKSVLAKFLIDGIFQSTQPIPDINCYFFFTEGLEDQQSLEKALCCILHQIFDRHEHLLSKEILKEFQDKGELFFNSFPVLWKKLVETSQQLGSGRIVVVLDALDECHKRSRSVLFKALVELYRSGQGNHKLKFLVTSRPYMWIRQDFQELKTEHPSINLSGDEDEGVDTQISKEIDIIIKARVNHLQKKLGLGDDEAQLIRNEVALANNRTYLWVYLTFDAMEKSLRLKRDDLKATIGNIPKSLDDAYEKILDSSSDIATTEKLLQIILAARRPLSLREMAVALSIKDTKNSFDKLRPDFPPDSQLRETIREQCGLFVVVHDSNIHLLHQTARYFLIQRTTATDPSNGRCVWSGSLCLKKSNSILANVCLLMLHATYLAHRWQYDSSGFQQYAARYWPSHFREAGKDVDKGQLRKALALLADPPQPGSWLQSYLEQEHLQHVLPPQIPPLMIASYFGLSLLVDNILQSQDFDLEARDAFMHRSALSWACAEGHAPVVESLLKHISPYATRFLSWTKWHTIVTASDKHGRKPLMLAVEGGHQQCVKLLLDHGADVDAEIRRGGTALMKATINGNEAMVELLLDHGANINTRLHDHLQNNLKPALAYAVERGHLGIIQLLIAKGATIYDSYNNILSLAVHGGNEAIVRLFLETRGRIPSECGLVNAAEHGRVAIVQLLLQRGADVDAFISYLDGRPALVAAAQNGHAEVVRLLLENGADIEAEGFHHLRALVAAATNGHEDVVKLLVNKGANLEAHPTGAHRGGHSLTALARAVVNGHEAVARLLLDEGAYLEARSSGGATPLHLATRDQLRDMVALLLLRGANPTAMDNKGRTTLSLASGDGKDKDILSMLKQAQERY